MRADAKRVLSHPVVKAFVDAEWRGSGNTEVTLPASTGWVETAIVAFLPFLSSVFWRERERLSDKETKRHRDKETKRQRDKETKRRRVEETKRQRD